MREIKLEDNRRALKLQIEYEEDLWAIASILKPGDVVYAKTSRELKTSTSSRRKAMILGVSVSRIEYQPFTSRLRVLGTIVSSPKELDLFGQHHTLSLEPGMKVVIYRPNRWSDQDLKRLERLGKISKTLVMITAIDDEEVATAALRSSGLQVIFEDYVKFPSKMQEEQSDRYMAEIKKLAKRILEEAEAHSASSIIIAGPAHWKLPLYEEIRKRATKKLKVYLENTSTGGIKGVNEVLRKETVKKALKENLLLEELSLMEDINSILARTPDLVVYTIDGVKKGVELRAISKIIVDSDLLRSTDEETRSKTLKILDEAERIKAEVIILESRHPELKTWIRSFGGIIGILRFKIS